MNIPSDLISRLKEATGRDRELDKSIALTFGWGREDGNFCKTAWRQPYPAAVWCSESYAWPPRFTEMLHDAASLIPDEFYWLIGKGKTRPDEPLYGAMIMTGDGEQTIVGEAEHDVREIAVVLAALKAVAAKTRGEAEQ